LQGLCQFSFRMVPIVESKIAQTDKVMSISHSRARRLLAAICTLPLITARGRLLERILSRVHQALEQRRGLIVLADFLKAKRLIVGLRPAPPFRPGGV
jgi:hypothetical protein